jgi:tetratricopeptide (TPR) repeat protein
MNKFYQYLVMAVCCVFSTGCTTLPESSNVVSAEHGSGSAIDRTVTEQSIPPEFLYRLLVAEIALKRGQLGVALDNYLEVAKKSRDPKVLRRTTRIAEYANEPEKAIQSARIWVDADPKDLDARQTLAILLLRHNEQDAALAELEKLITVSGDERPKVFMGLAAQLSREKDKNAAFQLMESLRAKFHDDPYANFAYAHLSTRMQQFLDAKKAVEHALELKPFWPDAIILHARILQLQGHSDEAVAYFSEELKAKELAKNTALRMSYARLLMDLKRMDDALDQYIILAQQDPDNPDVLYAAGLLSLQNDRTDDAEKYLKRLYNLGEHVMQASFYLGQVAEKKEQYKDAMQWYSKVVGGELYMNAQMRIATLLSKQKRWKEALQQARSIRAENSQDQLQLFLLEGDIMLDSGNYQAAFDIYDQALVDMPDDRNLLYARAIAAEKLDKLDVLEKDLHNILEQDPNNIQALNALGYTLADRTDRYEEALRYIKRAFELDPQDAAIIDSMGWVHYRMGDHKQALEYLKRAIKIMDDAEIASHLGEVLWASGKKDEALKVWNKALEDSPNNKAILDVMRRFGL